MLASLLESIFGCSHKRTTFPITPSRRTQLAEGTRRSTYVCCLECGKELDYDWKEMRIGHARIQSVVTTSLSVVNH
jgi:hypothetical protein